MWMWKTTQALQQRIEYTQLNDHRWRATFRGFVTISSEGANPRDCENNLSEMIDLLLANLVRSTRPEKVVHDEASGHHVSVSEEVRPEAQEPPPAQSAGGECKTRRKLPRST